MQAVAKMTLVPPPAHHRPALNAALDLELHDAADAHSIHPCLLQLNFNPVVLMRRVVAQQRRLGSRVQHQDVNITVVVKIFERSAAARFHHRHAGSRLSTDVNKGTSNVF